MIWFPSDTPIMLAENSCLCALLLAIVMLKITPTHSMLPCRTSSQCPSGRKCIQNECKRYIPRYNCAAHAGSCQHTRKNMCCLVQGYGNEGVCVRMGGIQTSKQILQEGAQCQRNQDSCFCQCLPGLVCVKNSDFFPYPDPLFTCQTQNIDQKCNDHLQCASDHCCSSRKCKPKKRLGERCYPKNDPEANLLCQGFCVDGTECQRDGPDHYTCHAVENHNYSACS